MANNFFHILNRGVEKRKIFLNKEDYSRFIYNLHDFNDVQNAVSYYHRRRKYKDIRHPYINGCPQRRELVDTLCWVLMNNHPHLFVREKRNGGASKYSQKIFGGYTKYFNEVNERSGVLFQGGSKIIPVTRDAHFLHLPYYIFSNPIELIEPRWKEKGIKNIKKVVHFLENYKYSSLLDIIGKDNFPETVNKELFYEIYGTNEREFKRDFIEWLGDFKGDFEEFEIK